MLQVGYDLTLPSNDSCGTWSARLLEANWGFAQVTYFQQRRVMEYNKKKTLEKLKAEGAKPMPEGMGPPQGPAGLSR